MTALRFPYPDAVFIVEDLTQDHQGRRWAVVSVQSLDGVGYLASPRRLEVFTERDWQPVAFEAARSNGLGRQEWLQRTGAVRIAIRESLQAPGEVSAEAVADEPQGETIPPFPELAWKGLFRDYRDIVGPTTEAPDVYHYFCFATVLGATLSRWLGVYHAALLYPNFFLALVGRTGMSRKDTARKRATTLLLALNGAPSEDPKFVMLPGVGSAEGLIESLGGNGKVVVVQEAELLSLMSKARRDATSNLIPHLTALYDNPDLYTLKTRAHPVKCQNTFLSLISGTTPIWLRQAPTEDLAQGGFANRFIYAFGDPKPPSAFPARVDASNWAHLLEDINQVRLWADHHGPELPVENTTREVFEAWYSAYHPRASGEGLLPALAVRFQTFAWKLALLYAAQDQCDHITEDHLRPALQVVDWLWESNQRAFVDFVRHGRGLENAIIDRLNQTDGHFLTKRYLYRALGVSAGDLERAALPMVRLGLLQEVVRAGGHGPAATGYQNIA